MKRKTIVISGGGTGGHIIPAIVIGKIIQHDFLNTTLHTLSGSRPIEIHMYSTHHVQNLTQLPASAFSGRNLFGKIASLWGLIRSIFSCLWLFRRHRPDLIIGVGGYVSFAAVVAGWLMRKPIIIQEQNVIPGLANRMLAYIASAILLGFQETEPYFRSPTVRKKCVFTGNFNLARAPGYLANTKNHSQLTLLISGGSQGARSLNTALSTLLPALVTKLPTLKIIWQCGATWEAKYQNQFSTLITQKHLKVIGHDEKLYQHYTHADLCVTRAGALTIADIITSHCPAILIPFPHAADNHQLANAQALTHHNAAYLIEESEPLWQKRLQETLLSLLTDHSKLTHMREQLHHLSTPYQNNTILHDTLRKYL